VDRDATLDTLFHEGFHQYLHELCTDPPTWFDEGMAEFFGAVRWRPDGRPVVRLQVRRLQELRHHLRDFPERLPDLDELMLMPKVRFYERDAAGLHYAMAWSLCHFFLLGDTDGRSEAEESAGDLFAEYARAVFSGKGREAAHADTFGADGRPRAETFRAAWLRHVNRLL